MKKKWGVLIQGVLLLFFFVPAAYSAPNIDGVMSYSDNSDWGSLTSTKTSAFSDSGTTLNNVVVEEGNTSGNNYDVEELGVYIKDNKLYIGLQTDYNLSSDPDRSGVYAGDFIFLFGDSTDTTLKDYDSNNDGLYKGEYAFAFSFEVADDTVDITFLSGNMIGTGVGTYANNYGTDWGIQSATTVVNLSDDAYTAKYSDTNADSSDYYLDGKYTLEIAIDLDSLSTQLSTLLSNYTNRSDYASVAMYWQPSCGNDFLAASTAFDYINNTEGSTISTIPEPATLMLFGMGLLGVGVLERRKRTASEI